MITETVRVSEKGKQKLIHLKRKTGIENWNILCRWALAKSLEEPSIPPEEEIESFSNIEMTWKTFGGKHADLYEAVFRERMHRDGIPDADIYKWFTIHLHRGISYLNGNTNDLIQLFPSLSNN
jgi:DNA sulfur modification protein DndE